MESGLRYTRKERRTPLVSSFPVLSLLLRGRYSRTLEGIEVHFAPDVERKLSDLASRSGRATADLLQDALAGYFDEVAQTRDMLDSRYDDLKSGRVKPISGDEVAAYFREKSAAARRSQPSS